MKNFFRIEEYKALLYRIFLVYFFYFIARLLFLIYNFSLLKVSSISEFFNLVYQGLAFDTTAILYINALFILFSTLPFWKNTKPGYQKFIFYLYFTTNLIAYATNFIDFIYYKFIYARTTIAVLDSLKDENNLGSMFFRFLVSYWHVFALFLVTSYLWIYLYKKVRIEHKEIQYSKIKYFSFSKIGVILILVLMVGGIRGDFKKSTRPLNMIDANRNVTKVEHADVILNTPFAIIRTLGKTSFKETNFNISDKIVSETIKPIKLYSSNETSKPNIVLFITESYGREYWGAFNKEKQIPNYVSYTPFLDRLAQNSLIFTDVYANGSKSIHGMSSVLAGIPSFKDAYTSSPYAKQKVESLVSILKGQGYDTSFFHGAPNGSMGFQGFGNILGFDHYYGKTEYNNDNDFDGVWGIWDEPFFQFMKQTLDKKKGPFFSTIFTVSSHEPYIVPKKYENKFPKGDLPIHQCVGYTDMAFEKFFEAAKKEPWFENTIFIITADHCNQTFYPEYKKVVNRSAIPLLIYYPKKNLVGKRTDIVQHIDIYPTILDMVGYNKPFRSWGRSLMSNSNETPYAINYFSNQYQFQSGNYICTFDGKKATGFYAISDKGLEKNLIAKRNAEMNALEVKCKAFLQDYFDRIVNKKL
ncbi:LTA synthase family protein [Flavobacterium proteolyticum]|uniref:Sulfatase-like hydrolase/transferase n=1 Tax=Flavobacterium proteolyticum TaxID=2911683 RepID=A0ABR9WSL0_9FLAO|nr:alkaline phosphatase family protein [Flavobacterium proteolyticum]MBE9576758.1 sulfatase-like hydrolase/transferase [Flavobacterium proteolyticum]